jgi:hypothetical protein
MAALLIPRQPEFDRGVADVIKLEAPAKKVANLGGDHVLEALVH